MGAVAVGEEIWILGGFAGDHPGKSTDLVQIYNTSTDTWTTGPSLPLPRASGGAAYSEGKIHYFGGLLPDRVTDVGDHFVYDVNNQEEGWITLAPLPEPRNHLGAAAVNGILYAIGGQFGHDAGVDDQAFLHAYDPQTNSWTEKNDLRSERSHFEPGTIVHNNKIIIVGGRRGSFIFDDITEYDPIADSWSELCQLPARLLAPSAKIIGDQLIVANGGDNGTCCLLDQTISMTVTPEENAEALRTLSGAERISITPENSESDVSMVEGLENSITIFPNPINDLLTVKNPLQNPINLTLIAPTGTVLIEKKDVLESTFDTSKIKPGLYILIVNNGKAYKRFRIIKK
jgi:N-acetylneuraminic acid mutarotase